MALKLLFDRKKMFVYPWYIADLDMTGGIEKIAGAKVAKSFVFFDSDHIHMYYEMKSANQVAKNFLRKVLEDKTFYKTAINNIYNYSAKLISFSEKIDRIDDISKISDKKLFAIYEEYMRQLRALRVWGWIPSSLDGMDKAYLTDHILENFGSYLESIGETKKLNEYYTILTSSEKMSEVQSEELAKIDLLLRIGKYQKKKEIYESISRGDVKAIERKFPKVAELLARHLKNFGWLTYAYSGPAMTMEYLLKSLAENIQTGNISDQKKKIIAHYNTISREKKKIIKKISLPRDLIYAFTVSSEFMFIKDYRKGIYQKSYVSMDKVISEIGNRLRISPTGVKYLVHYEIENALLKGMVKKYQMIAEKRIKRCCYVAINGKINVYEGKKAEKLIREVIKNTKKADTDFRNVTELKGMVAYPGKVRGIVKIVLVEKDVAKVTGGEILVSSATNPDLIMAMRKAAAFVTDTGGIISHAAIVSRELKKPCILGTKIATQVLRDGDEVEVDAQRGVVTILKRAKQ